MPHLAAAWLAFGYMGAAVRAPGAQGASMAQGSTKANECTLPANSRWCPVQIGQISFTMAVYDSDDVVSNAICNTGTWELHPSDFAAMGEPGNALDIGANLGFYSFALAAHGWTVTAFEPGSMNHPFLEASLCANPNLAQKITLNKFGLGADDDHCILIAPEHNLGDGIAKCGEDAEKPVPEGYVQRSTMDIRRLDDVLEEQKVQQIDFVKMDVEGFECHVMDGGQSLFTKYRPRFIQSEVWRHMNGCDPKDYLESFAKADYTVSKDRLCTVPGGARPANIEDRYMCRQSIATGMSLLEIPAGLLANERMIVWLTTDHAQGAPHSSLLRSESPM